MVQPAVSESSADRSVPGSCAARCCWPGVKALYVAPLSPWLIRAGMLGMVSPGSRATVSSGGILEGKIAFVTLPGLTRQRRAAGPSPDAGGAVAVLQTKVQTGRSCSSSHAGGVRSRPRCSVLWRHGNACQEAPYVRIEDRQGSTHLRSCSARVHPVAHRALGAAGAFGALEAVGALGGTGAAGALGVLWRRER